MFRLRAVFFCFREFEFGLTPKQNANSAQTTLYLFSLLFRIISTCSLSECKTNTESSSVGQHTGIAMAAAAAAAAM